jgi:hypothetical protein
MASVYNTLKYVTDSQDQIYFVSLFLSPFEVQFLKTWYVKKKLFVYFSLCFFSVIFSFIRCLLHIALLLDLLALWRQKPCTGRSSVQVFRYLVSYCLLVSVVRVLTQRTFLGMNE